MKPHYRNKPMIVSMYRFEFDREVSLIEAEETVQLARMAAEGLFSNARVRMDFNYHVHEPHRTIFIDGTTEVGDAIVKIFTSLALREFGEDAFRVHRIEGNTTAKAS
jgi:hypothetical protein